MRNFLQYVLFLILGVAAMTGCSLVDEDLTDCEAGQPLTVDYELRLVTNMTTELETVLDLQSDIYVQDALRNYLKDIFTDFAHDVDLSFYDVQSPMARLHHEQHIMDANQSSFTLSLPVHEYLHTAVANILDNDQVKLEGDAFRPSAELVQYSQADNTIHPHNTGLFTARLDMMVVGNRDQHFDVKLFMANAATALVIDVGGAPPVKDIRVVATGFADAFEIADSLYRYETNPLVRTQDLPVEGGSERCYAAVHFPSRDIREPAGTRVIIETEDPFLSEDAESSLWEWRVYVTLPDDTITESILHMRKPLRAGQLKILKVRLRDDGTVATSDPTVGVSITLDWHDAGHYEPDL